MRGAVMRLSRLEAKRGPKADARFFVFGLNDDDIAERYAAEIRAGTIHRGDPCTTPIWRGDGPIPSPQWATPNELTNDELRDAIHHLALATGREPIAWDADSDVWGAEITAVRREIETEMVEARCGP